MTDVFKWFVNLIGDFFDFFSWTTFEFFGYQVSLTGLFVAIVFVAIGFSIFWRGGKY